MKIKIEKPDETRINSLGVKNWPIWECDNSEFDWHYDQMETCYILEGEIKVETSDEEVVIGPGDFVTFPQDLDCKWTVTKPVRKHYNFS